jgi:hypothetical protein
VELTVDSPVNESLLEIHEDDYPTGTSLRLLMCTFPGLERVVVSGNGQKQSLVVVKARGEVREREDEEMAEVTTSSTGHAGQEVISPTETVGSRDEVGDGGGKEGRGKNVLRKLSFR